MVPVYVFLFLFSHLPLLLSTGEAGKGKNLKKCPPSFNCGHLGDIRFPFTNTEHHNCGMLAINGCDVPNAVKTVKLKNGKGRELELEVRNIDFRTVSVVDNDQRKRLQSENCTAFWNNIIPPRSSALGYFQIRNNITFFRCNRRLKVSPPKHFVNYTRCVENYVIYFGPGQNPEDSEGPLHACSRVQLPVTNFVFSADPFTFVTGEFAIEAQFSNECNQCFHDRGGQCQLDSKEEFYCDKAAEDKSWAWKLGLGIAWTGLGVAISWILIFVLILCLRLYKRKYALSHVRLRSINTGAGPYQSPDPDSGRLFFGVPIFSYKELEEATNNFDPTRILGDGAFGTVYYGKLQDGREVAVKHLFNHNYRRVERFMNEVEILTHLRHRNLVSLFGCTSRQSSELLLVYEYIPNGTVACHLHGDLAKSTSLPWPTRIKIAIETASALAYLHASDIIHRDVKTNNILLDSSFCVKVADFGLSRLFPNDVSHISTAPQGTPGYVDPEYHNYFQLTSKSDVYSFGVVLIELISSMPAVDMSRHRDEINLANLAIRKIQKSAVNELVDTSLGFESDNEVKRMIVSVAELAFQCLQKDKELRPSIDRVLEVLKRIESGKDKDEHIQEAEVGGDEISRSNVHLHPQLAASPNRDQVRLLMNMKSLSSPNTVTEKWESEYTTPNVSS